VPGAIGWTYAITLGFALVYLGEHYVADVLVGLLIAAAVTRLEPVAAPFVRAVARAVDELRRAYRHQGGSSGGRQPKLLVPSPMQEARSARTGAIAADDSPTPAARPAPARGPAPCAA
jgi:hypothetical protein